MSDLRPRGVRINLDGVERNFLFTLNAVDAIQDRMGKSLHEVIEALTDENTNMHTLRDLIVILSEDEAERAKYKDPDSTLEPITEKEAGYIIGLDNMWEITRDVLKAYGISFPEPEEDSPNAESGQQSS